MKTRSILSQILVESIDRCEALVKVQSLLNDPKYRGNDNKTIGETIKPKLSDWMDQYTNEQLKARNTDSKMFTDLKYIIQDSVEKGGNID